MRWTTAIIIPVTGLAALLALLLIGCGGVNRSECACCAGPHRLGPRVDFADAVFCFDFRTERLRLVLAKANNNIKIRTADEITECETYFSVYINTEMDFLDESGKNIASIRESYLTGSILGCSDCHSTAVDKVNRTLPSVLELDFQPEMSLIISEKLSKEDGLKNLLLFKNKIIDGHITVIPNCKPDFSQAYKINFSAQIAGMCERDVFNEYGTEER